MQMKNRKRFLALVAAAAMVIAPCSAFAANVTNSAISGVGGTGTGSHEGWVDKEYFKVEYPTVGANELNFVLDPQGLISSNVAASGSNLHHDGDSFEADQTLFFKTGATAWTHYSKAYEVKMWSSSIVDVSVTATVSSGSIEVTTDSAFNVAGEKASIYMAIAQGEGGSGFKTDGAVVDPSKKVAIMNVTAEALSASDFVTKDDGNGYEYTLTNPAPAAKSVKFHLEGAANPNANWKNYVDIKPTVELVWSVAPQSSETEVYAVLNMTSKMAIIGADNTQPTPAKFPDDAVISDFKIAGNDCDFTFSGGYVRATAANMSKAAGSAWDKTGTVVTFKANGKSYKTTLTW